MVYETRIFAHIHILQSKTNADGNKLLHLDWRAPDIFRSENKREFLLFERITLNIAFE